MNMNLWLNVQEPVGRPSCCCLSEQSRLSHETGGVLDLKEAAFASVTVNGAASFRAFHPLVPSRTLPRLRGFLQSRVYLEP